MFIVVESALAPTEKFHMRVPIVGKFFREFWHEAKYVEKFSLRYAVPIVILICALLWWRIAAWVSSWIN